MTKIYPSLLVLCVALFCCVTDAVACSSAVISGRATPDGRPLLWKHRDTGFLRNHIAFVKGEKYDFLANVNSDNFPGGNLPEDPALREAWVGTNSAGFALMNTQSYNLMDMEEGEERGAANGRIIFRALEVCATVQDFCHFLDTIGKPSLIEANFGAIDAQGGAAMFEVDYHSYVMYDANDPAVAPQGYLTRTNYSISGKHGELAGYVRALEVDRVCAQIAAGELQEGCTVQSEYTGRKKKNTESGGFTPELILQSLSRSFRNNQLGIDLRSGAYNLPEGSGWFIDQDFIPRNSTSCSIIVQGVKPAEAPELTCMWTLLGYPPTGIAVPLFVRGAADGLLPECVLYNKVYGYAPLSHWSLTLADKVFSLDKGMGTDKYLHWEALYNKLGTGYMQRLQPVEAEVFKRSKPVLRKWYRRGGVDVKELRALYRVVEEVVSEAYRILE